MTWFYKKNTSLAIAALGIAGSGYSLQSKMAMKNTLPRWRGFNLLDFMSPTINWFGNSTTEDDFRWMVDWGFDFVRILIAYPCYLKYNHFLFLHPNQQIRSIIK